eukprot:TRINITY_DN953_c0_g1_i1.p1 TRINITY_DN953_c0_g1~~TRINITY_DN953_c0_g1_i1.p1  ORF type:complete len:337 (-),score=68.65 TRINITY_DN953_c0_g1_i1:153-1163(-)
MSLKRPHPDFAPQDGPARNVQPRMAGAGNPVPAPAYASRAAPAPQYPAAAPPTTAPPAGYPQPQYPQQTTAAAPSMNVVRGGAPPPSMNVVRGGVAQPQAALPQAGILASGGAAPSAQALYSNAMSSIRGAPSHAGYHAPQFYYPAGAQVPMAAQQPYASHNPFFREQQIQYQAKNASSAMKAHRKGKRDGKPTFIRQMGGKTWEDESLAEWPENDYRLFVGNLGNDVSNEPLRKAFSKYSSLAMVKVIRDKKTQRTRGFGFVSFLDPQDCLKAYREMNGQYIMNRPCQIKKSDWKTRNIKKSAIKDLRRGDIHRKHKKPYKAPPNLPRYIPEKET